MLFGNNSENIEIYNEKSTKIPPTKTMNINILLHVHMLSSLPVIELP